MLKLHIPENQSDILLINYNNDLFYPLFFIKTTPY